MTSLKLEDIQERYKGKRIGFKATNSDMRCRGYEYSLGITYKHNEEIIPCMSGFHLCKEFISIYKFYPNLSGTIRFFIVEYGKNFIDEKTKIVTDELTFLEEINPMDYIQQNINDLTKDDWEVISNLQALSENFIRQHESLVDWNKIGHNQTLSKAFKEEFKDKAPWDLIDSWEELFNSVFQIQ